MNDDGKGDGCPHDKRFRYGEGNERCPLCELYRANRQIERMKDALQQIIDIPAAWSDYSAATMKGIAQHALDAQEDAA